jgi:ABC-type glycerol-3-phosphate transport system substrate-binding protein
MTDLWLTVYGNQPSPLRDPSFLLNEFEFQKNVQVRVSQMIFEEAWTKMLHYALYGGGPHISLIGSIWTSTLKPINTLRRFSGGEVYDLGGADAFFPAAWEYARAGGNEVWSIPFEIFTYLVLYRKDLLAQAGIPEAGAFASAQAMIDTVSRLKAAGGASPLLLPSGRPFSGRPHILSSWIWGAGGEFFSKDGARPLFVEAEAMRGIADFFRLYRLMLPSDQGLDPTEIAWRFASGNAAVTIAGPTMQETVRLTDVPVVVENLGVAPVPGVPWIGGTNIVLWKEVSMNPEQEQAALDLVKFLSTTKAQIKTAAAEYLIPARVEALAQHAFTVEAFRAAVEYSMRKGRAYPTLGLWMRIVNELRPVLEQITAEALADPGEEIEKILQRRLVPLADRLRLMLA